MGSSGKHAARLLAMTLMLSLASSQPSSWSQSDKVTASNGSSNDYFGRSVAVDGSIMVVGAYMDDPSSTAASAGSAYVFSRNSDLTWRQVTQLYDTAPQVNGYYGQSVSVSQGTVVVGAYGSQSVFIYVANEAGSWTLQQQLKERAALDFFGSAVDIDENILVVGANGDDQKGSNAGAAYVYSRTGTVWSQQKKLLASDGSDLENFGGAVAVSGNSIVIGALFDASTTEGDIAGSAYVYAKASNFGYAVDIDGDMAVIGANGANVAGAFSGAAYVFSRSGTTWTQAAKLVASDGKSNNFFGQSVAIMGGIIAVGAYGRGGTRGVREGAAYLFKYPGGSWVQDAQLIASDSSKFDAFGQSIGMDNQTIAIGAYGANMAAGSVYTYNADVEIQTVPPVAQTSRPTAAPSAAPQAQDPSSRICLC